MSPRVRMLALALPALAFAACAAQTPTRPRSDPPPRVRCLADPRREASETTRPLFFLFCIESP